MDTQEQKQYHNLSKAYAIAAGGLAVTAGLILASPILPLIPTIPAIIPVLFSVSVAAMICAAYASQNYTASINPNYKPVDPLTHMAASN